MELIWKQRKRIWCGLPWTFTVYSFNDERIFIESGILTQVQDEVRMYRVRDITLRRSLIQRIFKMGTIHLDTSDKSMGSFDIINIKDVFEVKETLSQLVEEQRKKNRVSTREFIVDDGDDDFCG